MGTIEQEANKKIKYRRIQDGVLLSLYASVGLTLILTAPGAVRLLKTIDPDIKKKRDPAQRMSQAITRLVSKGLVERIKTGDGKTKIILTKKGTKEVEKLQNPMNSRPLIPKRWDKRWRIVVFDIWERRRPTRDRLRFLLRKVGFVKVQNSVWVYPYDCEEILAFIKTDLKLSKGILYFVAEGVENDAELRAQFGLPNK